MSVFGKKEDPKKPEAPQPSTAQEVSQPTPMGKRTDPEEGLTYCIGPNLDITGKYFKGDKKTVFNQAKIVIDESIEIKNDILMEGGSVSVGQSIIGENITVKKTALTVKLIKGKKVTLEGLTISCDIEAEEVLLAQNSSVTGNVTGTKSVHVMSGCTVKGGTLTSPTLRPDDGCSIECAMRLNVANTEAKTAAAKDAKPAPAPAPKKSDALMPT